jgi:D-threonate/D-erythronate kinase
VQVVVAEPLNLISNELREEEKKRMIEEIVCVIKKGYAPVLTTNHSEETRQRLKEWNGKNGMEIGNRIALSLGQIAASVINVCEVSGLILTGGDIAYRTFEQLGVESLRIVSEIEEGIPFCEIVDGALKGLPVVTKAGAFGNPHSLVNAINKINDLL